MHLCIENTFLSSCQRTSAEYGDNLCWYEGCLHAPLHSLSFARIDIHRATCFSLPEKGGKGYLLCTVTKSYHQIDRHASGNVLFFAEGQDSICTSRSPTVTLRGLHWVAYFCFLTGEMTPVHYHSALHEIQRLCVIAAIFPRCVVQICSASCDQSHVILLSQHLLWFFQASNSCVVSDFDAVFRSSCMSWPSQTCTPTHWWTAWGKVHYCDAAWLCTDTHENAVMICEWQVRIGEAFIMPRLA